MYFHIVSRKIWKPMPRIYFNETRLDFFFFFFLTRKKLWEYIYIVWNYFEKILKIFENFDGFAKSLILLGIRFFFFFFTISQIILNNYLEMIEERKAILEPFYWILFKIEEDKNIFSKLELSIRINHVFLFIFLMRGEEYIYSTVYLDHL